ncbi:MAG: serine hydrolase [Natronospirillum sp.]
MMFKTVLAVKTPCAAVLASVLITLAMTSAAVAAAWQDRLLTELIKADADYSGDLGVYVKDVESGDEVSLRAEEYWYLSSTVKVPIAVELLARIEQGALAWDTLVTLSAADYLDGAGETNWVQPGTELTIEYLFNQMLTHSDNTATDALLRTLGVDSVNARLQTLVPEGIAPITTLADVRRLAYREFNEAAMQFTSDDFFRIRASSDVDGRADILADIFGLTRAELAQPDMDSAFGAYYAKGYNSGTMMGMGQLLEAIVTGAALSPDPTELLLDTMVDIATGQQRIKAGLPETARFAHKTGTQHRRTCNVGIAWADENSARPVIIAACTRGPRSVADSERALRAVGEAVTASGVLTSAD